MTPDKEEAMKTDGVVLTLSGFEQRLMVGTLVEQRNDMLEQQKPTEDVDNLILKVIDAPKRKSRWHNRDAR